MSCKLKGLRARADFGLHGAITVLGLVLLVLWELSGWDLTLTHIYASAQGFAWRDAWLTETLLHAGGRRLAQVLFLVALWDCYRAAIPGPTRQERWYWLGITALSLLAVPSLKSLSTTSCPWDLAEFGGRAYAHYVPHWMLGVHDGGAGHCFPAGHASSAYAFFGLYFLWQPHRPVWARSLLLTVGLLGAAFTWAQLARGAHFLSHSLWTAWLCWLLAVGAKQFAPKPTDPPAVEQRGGPIAVEAPLRQ